MQHFNKLSDGNLLKTCKIILWYESIMAQKRALETVELAMNIERRFGGAMMLLTVDFLQTLSVIPQSTLGDDLNAYLKLSYFWRYVK